MDSGVDVRVNDVDNAEIDYLTTVIEALKSDDYRESVIDSNQGNKAFVVTVKKCELQELKDALRVILQVVTPERVDIDT
ncbi:MAG: hypothetical protein ACE5IY_05545 [bacterium]